MAKNNAMRRFILLLTLIVFAIPGIAQTGAKNGEWRTYGGDLGSTRYSPLDKINAGNFNKLEVAWRFKTDALGPRPEFNLQATPLMVNGVLYLTAGTRRAAIALDAKTGEMLWMHSENEGKRGSGAPRQLSGRGLTYWTDGRDARIFYVTPGYRLIGLDAKTGALIPGFGKNGVVDLKLDDDQNLDLETADVGFQSAPVVAKDTVIIGAAHTLALRPRVKSMRKALSAASTFTPESASGFSTRFRTPAKSVTIPGRRILLPTLATPAYGDRSQSTTSWALYIFPLKPLPVIFSADTAPVTGCSARPWSRSISRPVNGSGIISSSIMASGTGTSPAPRFSSTS